jgi:hypothetical protein
MHIPVILSVSLCTPTPRDCPVLPCTPFRATPVILCPPCIRRYLSVHHASLVICLSYRAPPPHLLFFSPTVPFPYYLSVLYSANPVICQAYRTPPGHFICPTLHPLLFVSPTVYPLLFDPVICQSYRAASCILAGVAAAGLGLGLWQQEDLHTQQH